MLSGFFRMLFNSLIILLGAGFILAGLLGFSSGGTGMALPAIWNGQARDVWALPEADSAAAAGLQAEMPIRLSIPAIQLDAPIVPATASSTKISGRSYPSWEAPEGGNVGWQGDSAHLGEPGNVVLNGHHNVSGEVFAHLIDLEEGDEIAVYGETHVFRYHVTEIVLLLEKDQPRKVRLANSRWIRPTSGPRLTLVTCWPFETNTHRLIIIAEPD